MGGKFGESHKFCINHWQWRIQDFPEGVPTPEGRQPIYLTNFSPQLHENEEILVQRWGHIPGAP